jgi:hypothetical protein
VNCARATCAQPVRTCPNKERMGSCAYFACTGFIHTATDLHACADLNGEATPRETDRRIAQLESELGIGGE